MTAGEPQHPLPTIDAYAPLGGQWREVLDKVQADRVRLAERVEELEEIIRDLVMHENEKDAVGTWPRRAETFAKTWARAAEAVGMDDGGDA